MKLLNDKAVKRAKQRLRCEHCDSSCPQGTDPCHVYSRGAGQVDADFNLASLCRECHSGSHANISPSREELENCAAAREGIAAHDIKPCVDFIRRLDKYASPVLIKALVEEDLTPSQQKMVVKALRDAGKLT